MDYTILTTAAKVARIIDDNFERDEALKNIATYLAAANCPEESLKVCEQVRYVDIRADALRKSLDNLLERYSNLKCAMPPIIDDICDKMLEDTLAVPDPVDRCKKLHCITIFILRRLDKEKCNSDPLSILFRCREEQAKLADVIIRNVHLHSICQMYQFFKMQDEASNTLELILERISEIQPASRQGRMLGRVAQEYWKMEDYLSAFDCIGRAEDRKAQTYAYEQLVESLVMSGKIEDAENIVEQMDESPAKQAGKHIVALGKEIFKSMPPIHFNDDDKHGDNNGEFQSLNLGHDIPEGKSGIHFDNIVLKLHIEDNSAQSDSEFDGEDKTDEADDVNMDRSEFDEHGVQKAEQQMNEMFANACTAMPPEAFRVFLDMINRMCRGRDMSEMLAGQSPEKIEDFKIKRDEVGFDAAWQDVISQGDYRFAVDLALDYFYSKYKKVLMFGLERLYDKFQKIRPFPF